QSAFQSLNSLELPNTHQEEWRFTNLAPMKSIEFRPVSESSKQSGADVPSARANSIVFVNGRFSKDLSVLPKDVKAGSLKEQPGLENYFGKLTPYDSDLFT